VEVGDSVKRSLDLWESQQWAAALTHGSNAVDATAKKRYPREGVATRYRRTIRDSLDIFASMAAPGIDFTRTRFPIAVHSDRDDGRPDIADVLLGLHRMIHGHADDLPNGCELTPHGPRPATIHIWRNGKVQLPASAAIGLLAVAVFAPENKGEAIPEGYHLSWNQHEFRISLWWGWQDHYREIASSVHMSPEALDFSDFWGAWAPIAG